ncbi:hypothetical protein NP493_35g00014 [Ridgeia piscesae]|uniref:Small ribosomal subunit protein uS7 domain-containing protein n=1 Tax=Ridgeia piscesae TaxID=27915 RepID=A0AAD9PCN9_RIDPI|nr:hypothetical protein NP493_35g00014 [Ridgeia piscesae]
MAGAVEQLGKCMRCMSVCKRTWTPAFIQTRTAIYQPIYLEPTFRKEDLQQPLDELDKRKYQPIKAATNEQTSLASYDAVVAKFIRILTKEGNKKRARKIVDKTFENIKLIQLEKYHKAATEEERQYIECDPLTIFHQAITNCKPLLTTQKVKRGGVMYTVPIPVKPNYQMYKAMTWLIDAGTDKERDIRVWDKLAYELLNAAQNEGKGVRKKQELHKLCEANRAYAHFRW